MCRFDPTVLIANPIKLPFRVNFGYRLHVLNVLLERFLSRLPPLSEEEAEAARNQTLEEGIAQLEETVAELRRMDALEREEYGLCAVAQEIVH